MLSLTEAAKEAVRQMVDNEEAPEGSGLRIAAEQAQEGKPALSLELTEEPAAGDAVVEEDGARIFLDPLAASFLDDKLLDATEHDDHIHLTVQNQTGGASTNGRVV